MIQDNPPVRRPPRNLAFAHRQADGLAQLFQVAALAAPTGPFPAVRDLKVPTPAPRPRRTWRERLTRHPWPLAAILAVQAVLSLRLVWSNTAFPDEALYLWSGHLEWTHWLHGTQLPAFPGYFSGAPVVYPPLGALADTYGGLAGARILSLAFMLLATCALYGTGARIFSHRAGLFGAGLFASGAATQFLGAFATYDAMALSLLAGATWLAVRSAACQRMLARAALLTLAGIVLALADAAKYAATLFDPVVFAVAVLMTWRARGRLPGGAAVFAVTAGAIAAALRAAGKPYWRGIAYTTLSRAHGTSSPFGIVADSIGWAGLTALLAVFGLAALFVTRAPLPQRLTACVLTGAVALAPANQARIHVFTSLFKHVGFGAWFAAIIGGHALAALACAVPKVKGRGAALASAGAVGLCATVGLMLAQTHFLSWPDTTRFTAALHTTLPGRPGNILAADNGNVIEYYLPGDIGHDWFYGPWFMRYQDPATGQHLTGLPAYKDAIRHRFFAVIALSFSDSRLIDDQLDRYITASGRYRLTAVLPYELSGKHSAFRIWTAR